MFTLILAGGQPSAAAEPPHAVGVVSHVKVLSDKVADVSSLEAWQKSFIKAGMTDEEKAVAAWKSSVSFVYQDPPPLEFLQADCVHDSIKSFNVYGYGMCCCASGRMEQLARYLGLPARGFGIHNHSVPEVFWDNEWHMLDASLANYFTRPDGKIASVADISQSVQAWLKEHPEYKGNNEKLTQIQQAGGWTGWKQGPALLANCSFYDAGGWWPAKTHGWNSTMQEFDGGQGTPFGFDYGYSQGYEVNIRLRRGERLTRNWFNSGLHVNGVLNDGGEPGCLKAKAGEGSMAFLRKLGDLTDGRIGSGKLEYEVPLADGGFRHGALAVENLAARSEDPQGPALHVKDPSQPGALELEMPCSYVYLNGQVQLDTAVGTGGKVRLLFSDNNGLDWRELATVEKSGTQTLDLSKFAFRRYDYRLRVLLEGQGTGLNRLHLSHDVQCSQRALPALDRGENTISFSTGPQEGTITIEGSTQEIKLGKQVALMDFHPVLKDIERAAFRPKSDGASVTFPIATPGEMTRLRMGGHYRLRDKRDQWELRVSFDDGRTFKTLDTQTGPYPGICKYISFTDIPPGTKTAQVQWVGCERNTACIFLLRIDADFKQAQGGFVPVKVTYVWEEAGHEKKDVHIARSPEETYKILCATKPRMKSIALELAE
ncbi:MAG TPA: hypothetical protein VNT26_16280 [Candidatus Sulfotelmatobacter sp.]|nr:hypothetical protein [Candidatus Sulfotelmatobacter sp.]